MWLSLVFLSRRKTSKFICRSFLALGRHVTLTYSFDVIYSALIMCRFARDCMMKTWEVTKKLEETLGPDTGDLTMRIGCHSGPVTGGVLRGEKSRFQLFGDTVRAFAIVVYDSDTSIFNLIRLLNCFLPHYF
jgi:hypothetical protein